MIDLFRSRWAGLWLPVLSSAVFYLLFYLISAWAFAVQIAPAAIPYDYALQLLLAWCLYALSRRLGVFLVVQGLVMGILYVGNAIKISFFGGPIVPDDVFALRSLLLVLDGWRFVAVAIPLAALTALPVLNLAWRRRASYLALGGMALLAAALVQRPLWILQPLDSYFGNSVWDQRSNYLNRGASLYALQEGARFLADKEVAPARGAALSAAHALLGGLVPVSARTPFRPRNVHIVLEESFWDPGVLTAGRYSQDPLAREFRHLWQATGQSTAMSPVFGGYTANAEFEVLCGFPVVKDSVKFERRLTNNVPCLPRILAERGYTTIASHPNVPVFWNRTNAYRRMGFAHYWAQNDFVLDDMNREFLSDASLFRQVAAKISGLMASGQPVLDYVVTYFGHWNYPLSETRPPIIESQSQVPEVGAYANTVHYKSQELMDFLQRLRERDPQGIIVVFGDHLPFLGGNFAGYVESGVLAASRDQFSDEMFRTYVRTPLVIIDGENGPVRIGNVAMYEVPGIILGLLGYDQPTIMDYTRPPDGMQVRPLPGMHVNFAENGAVEVCKEPPYSEGCTRSARWLGDVLTVGTDVFTGKQYTLPEPLAPNQRRPSVAQDRDGRAVPLDALGG